MTYIPKIGEISTERIFSTSDLLIKASRRGRRSHAHAHAHAPESQWRSRMKHQV